MANAADTLGQATTGPSGDDIVRVAMSEVGKPYSMGAAGPNEFDCSGLVKFVYQQVGLNTPRTTYDMTGPGSNLVPIQRSQLESGDLLFSRWPGESRPSSHVAIYDGHGNVIEAPQPGENVTVTKLTDGYWSHIDQIRRVPGLSGGSNGAPQPPGVLQTLGGVAQSVGAGILGPNMSQWIASPNTITDALTNVGNAVGSIAGSAAQAGQLAGLATRLFLPTNLLRAGLLAAGTLAILIGIWFLAMEVKDS